MTNNGRKLKRYHPGSYIVDSLESLNMSAKEFSIRTGISERTLSDLLNEKGDITFDIASKLGAFFGTSSNFWVNLQNSYNTYIKEQQTSKEVVDDYSLLKPHKQYLIDNHLIDANDSDETVVIKTRHHFSINRLENLSREDLMVSFKKDDEEINKGDKFAQNLWLAWALTEARKIDVEPYDSQKAVVLLNELKPLMNKDPKEFYIELVDRLSKHGIAFVYIPYLEASHIYGACKWLSSNKVMVAVANHDNRADTFWYTLFHEISHVLLEHKRYCLFQCDDEITADIIMTEILFSDYKWPEFVNRGDYSEHAIEEVSKINQIPPYIVVGQLERMKKINKGDEVFSKYMISYSSDDFNEMREKAANRGI